MISNSEVGAGTLRVEPSVFLSWCTNMAIMKQAAMKKYHVGRSAEVTENWEIFRDETRQQDDKAFFMKVGDVAEAAFDGKIFEMARAQIRGAIADKILVDPSQLPAVVEATIRTLSLPQGTSGSILTYLAQGGDLSRWGVVNAVTATANGHVDYEVSTDLERAGGELLAMEAAAWGRIACAVAA